MHTVTNFGRNVVFTPAVRAMPRTESQLLALLEKHSSQPVRVMGGLHAWSEAAVTDGLLLDLRHLKRIELRRLNGQAWAEIQAGCSVDRALRVLGKAGYTLPTHGVIGKQSIAGAISTATHGSGNSSMSDHVEAIRIASCDAVTGRASIHTVSSGRMLKAARCAIGCMGVVLSVLIRCPPKYLVKETAIGYASINAALKATESNPLQQFYLLPFLWAWYGQQRHALVAATNRSPWWKMAIYYPFRFLGFDLIMSGLICFVALLNNKGTGMMRWLYSHFFSRLVDLADGQTIVDESQKLLMTRHDLFRHVEMELFVPTDVVSRAAAYVERVLRYCGDDQGRLPSSVTRLLTQTEKGMLQRLKGSYAHHFAITFRRVLPDRTLISMTADGRERYAISLISYNGNPQAFYEVMDFLAVSMARLFDARPHWGKYCPLDRSRIEGLYPGLARFRRTSKEMDPGGRFRNSFTARTLGL